MIRVLEFAFLFVALVSCAGGIPVALLQEDGTFSPNSHLRYKGGLPRNIRDFTLCARLSLNYLRGSKNVWLSIANATHNDLLTGAFLNDDKGPRISLSRYHKDIEDEITIKFEKGFDFQSWHHYCFVFSSFAEFPYPGGNVNLTNKVYMDGVFLSQVTRIVPKSSFTEIDRGASLILGQRLDNSRVEYDDEESFSGRYSEVELWRGELVTEEIKDLSNCRPVSTRGLLIEWNINAYDGSEVQRDEIELRQLCKDDKLRGRALFNQGAPYEHYRFICDKFEGQLPTFESKRDRREQYKEIAALFEENFKNVSCQLNEDLFFWSGITEDINNEENVFLNSYTREPIQWDPNLWPGPASGDIACTMVRGESYLAKEKCTSKLPCGVCNYNPFKKLVLKGLCYNELQNDGDFDTEYYVDGLYNERVHFKGVRASHIFFDDEDGRWTLQSFKDPTKRSKLVTNSSTQFPIGRLTWEVANTDEEMPGICNLKNGEKHIMAYSDCHPEKFTCSNGACIDLSAKCNSIVDCEDGTDEADCEFLVLNEEYSKEKLPVRDDKEPVQVYFSILITAFPEIDASNFKLKSDYDLSLRWYDPRLKFRDLNNLTEFNDLSENDKTYLWSPKLEFVNALGPVTKGLDEATSIRLIKEEKDSLPEDFTLDREAKLFSGKTNSIALSRRYSQDHTCKFDLYYFPFDSQVCALVFELRDKTEDFIQFEPDAEPVFYRGDRSLNQYEIETENLDISKNSKNFSVAKVRFVLRHRTEFHLVTAFVQTLIVLIVAFASFFFDIHDFSDRIMVNAVLLLVIATISSSIQTSVPSTSYFKLIDVWLLFCVVMIVVTILLHTIMAAILAGEKGDSRVRRSAFKRIRTPSGSLAGSQDHRRHEDEDYTTTKFGNYGAMVFFVLVIIIFNIAFWVIALKEYNMGTEELLEEKPIK